MTSKIGIFSIMLVLVLVGTVFGYSLNDHSDEISLKTKDDVKAIIDQDDGYAKLRAILLFQDKGNIPVDVQREALKELVDAGSTGNLQAIAFNSVSHADDDCRKLYLEYFKVQLEGLYDALIQLSVAIPKEKDKDLQRKKFELVALFVEGYSNKDLENDLNLVGVAQTSSKISENLKKQKKAVTQMVLAAGDPG